MRTFRDRRAAGERLAPLLDDLVGRPGVAVLALPRGGVPVAAPVAAHLGAPLDVLIVRKLGAPSRPELAVGAICDEVQVIDWGLIDRLGVEATQLERIIDRERTEMIRRSRLYRGADPSPLDVADSTVVVVDDGIATGATMAAGCEALRQLSPSGIMVAAPVASRQAVARLRPLVDRIVCVAVPRRFGAVGHFYDDFTQTTDEEVRALVERPIGGP